jgi:Na+-translocating ferredoxin:NAD+ oxidoreductase RnfD subunit
MTRLSVLVLLATTLALTPCVARANPPPDAVLRPGLDLRLTQLLGDDAWRQPLEGAYRFDHLEVTPTGARFLLRAPLGTTAATLELTHPAATPDAPARSASFAITPRLIASDPAIARILAAATASIVARDRGAFWSAPPRPPPPPPEAPPPPAPAPTWPVALLAALAVAALAAAWTRLPIDPAVKVTHVLPVGLQSLIFLYWSLYWPPLGRQLTVVALQVLFAYALDLALSYARTRRLVLSFGPLPVVLSTNLFIVFAPAHAAMHALPIAVAIASRHLFRRDDRPIFNPSALGLAVLGVLNLLWPALGDPDVAQEFALAPSMAELLLALALIVQLRLPVVLVAAGVVMGLAGRNELSDLIIFMPTWPPVLLVAVLLATDPATIPRTNPGRLLSGLALGVAMGALGAALTRAGYSDFYGKVLPVPLVNLLAPEFDRLGATMVRAVPALGRALDPRYNRRHVALWLAVMVVAVIGNKYQWFDPNLHAYNRTPCLVRNDEGRLRCQENPLFCEGFRVDLELWCWRAGAPRPPAVPAALSPPAVPPAGPALPRGADTPPGGR